MERETLLKKHLSLKRIDMKVQKNVSDYKMSNYGTPSRIKSSIFRNNTKLHINEVNLNNNSLINLSIHCHNKSGQESSQGMIQSKLLVSIADLDSGIDTITRIKNPKKEINDTKQFFSAATDLSKIKPRKLEDIHVLTKLKLLNYQKTHYFNSLNDNRKKYLKFLSETEKNSNFSIIDYYNLFDVKKTHKTIIKIEKDQDNNNSSHMKSLKVLDRSIFEKKKHDISNTSNQDKANSKDTSFIFKIKSKNQFGSLYEIPVPKPHSKTDGRITAKEREREYVSNLEIKPIEIDTHDYNLQQLKQNYIKDRPKSKIYRIPSGILTTNKSNLLDKRRSSTCQKRRESCVY